MPTSTPRASWKADPNFRIDTPRLFLSHYSPDSTEDLEFVVRTLSSSGGNPLLFPGNGHIIPGASAIEEVEFLMRQRNDVQAAKFGYPGWFCITLKETGERIGICSLTIARPCPEELWWPAPDVGFTLLPGWRGKGYATEAAKAVMKYALEEHNVQEVIGLCEPDNAASCKALARLGFVQWGKGKIRMLKDFEMLVWGPPGRTSLEGFVGDDKVEITG
ncbi:acyl-CoA N-acyltransferase [Cylindrobasidium torrendii FP15055 ss-10]|uniref:Acyl-CoA N-acyltransferase n=1 Tax=Cylindrobasidium torrendii FP15055 ss-10 TaxID=1314674 RepID=A0A0D7AXD8_9AGAR|nr:acyl-CoA N-acyltransferase [Cylindrobasidium torrendii FP15055 ss-10]